MIVRWPDATRVLAGLPFEECGPKLENENVEAGGAAPIFPTLVLIPFPFSFSLFFLRRHGADGSVLSLNFGGVLENGEHGCSLRWDVESDFQRRGLEYQGILRWFTVHNNANRAAFFFRP